MTPASRAIADLIGSVDGLPADLSARKRQHLEATGYGRRTSSLTPAFCVALLSRRDAHQSWLSSAAAIRARRPARLRCRRLPSARARQARPCSRRLCCERRAVISAFHLGEEPEEVLELIRKYADVPMSFADACLVRMTRDCLTDPILLTTDPGLSHLPPP